MTKWDSRGYGGSQSAVTLFRGTESAISPLARPPTKTGFQSWLGNKSACAKAEYSFRFQWG